MNEQVKRLPNMALWNNVDIGIAIIIGMMIGFLIGLAV